MVKLKYSDDDRQYLQMMQDNIARMANNSSNCKNWLVTIVAGLLAISCGIQALNGWIILAVFPTITFWYLDVYYLHMERKMRNRELDFIIKAKALANDLRNDDMIALYNAALYNFSPLKKDKISSEEADLGFVETKGQFFSKSERNFYLSVIIVIIIITVILNWDCIGDFLSSLFQNCRTQNS